jgi:hypothetical protein
MSVAQSVNRRRLVLGGAALPLLPLFPLGALPPATAQAQPALPLFDAHLHYSHDAWERVPPKEAAALLRQAGLKRAMVSSSNDDGTQMLLKEAPELVLPVLRPYRTRSDVGSWVRDETVVAHLEQRLARYRYVAIGEYHVSGADADLPVMRRVVALAREHWRCTRIRMPMRSSASSSRMAMRASCGRIRASTRRPTCARC